MKQAIGAGIVLLTLLGLTISHASALCRIEWSGAYTGSMETLETSKTTQAVHELFDVLYGGECTFEAHDFGLLGGLSDECCSFVSSIILSGGGRILKVVCPEGYYYDEWISINCPDGICDRNEGLWDVVCETLIELATFSAVPQSKSVQVFWETASETDNAGFHLYRADSENGDYIQINDELLPAKGSPTEGASYDFVDDAVRNRKTYWYKLEDIDVNGVSTMHGPVSATPRLLHGLFD